MISRLETFSSVLLVLLGRCDAFAATSAGHRRPGFRTPAWKHAPTTTTTPTTIAFAAAQDGENGEKRKRRRKSPPASPSDDPVQVSREIVEDVDDVDDADGEDDAMAMTKEDLAAISEIARYEFQTDKKMGISRGMEVASSQATSSSTSSSISGNAIPLPDIKEARKRKQMEEEIARTEQEKKDKKVRIKRSDKEAFRRLLEQQPFADADESYFVEESYGTVSALLGERAKPFLAIPFGPLQVGHFVGALVILLMAFVEYPGFPLTNLPTPLRGCFQGGLATVYAINTVLAVIVAFKAPERGQAFPIWVAKTFTVGGLAYDQLMQLPTLAEIEKSKSVKGARATPSKKR